MKDISLSELLGIAIKREEAAFDFYMDLNSKIEDQSTKDTLKWIAGEEQKHKNFLINYRDGKYDDTALRMDKVVSYKIAEYMQEPEISADSKPSEIFLLASHRELKSYHFYTKLAELHPTGEAQEIMLKMANEELKHKEKMEYLYSNTAFPQTSGG